MKNVVLIGMPGAGKSTLGVLLAKALNMDFIDSDISIQKYTGELLCETIGREGIDAFLDIEQKVILGLDCTNTIIATGGSAVYGQDAMMHLKENAIVVYIKLSVDEIVHRVSDITSRGVVVKHGKTIYDAFDERVPLYNKYADIIIDCNEKDIEHCVREIKDLIEKAI